MKIVVSDNDLYNMARSLYCYEQNLAAPSDPKFAKQWYDISLNEWKAKAEAVIKGLNEKD